MMTFENSVKSKFNTVDMLRELCSIEGVSTEEHIIAKRLKGHLDELCDAVEIDKNGNLLGFIKSQKIDAKTLMLEAHMDRIGLMITQICEDGSLKFTNIGGIDERILPYSEVLIYGKKKIKGVIFPFKSEDGKAPDIEMMKIETGYTKAELEGLVSIGDTALVAHEFTGLCGDIVSCGALDNRAGILSVLNCLSNIKRERLAYNLIVLFSVQEELGLHGAYTAAKNINPDAAIVIDVTHGETRDTKGDAGVFPLGSGAVICRGPNLDYGCTNQLISLAKERDIPYKIEVAAGSSGTDAWAIQTCGKGIPSMLISIPLRYMHTNTETLDIKDIDAVSSLLVYAAEGGVVL